MLSLFSTSSDKAGFRLQYMEVFNWGTFDGNVFKIQPKGNNSLLTGANASGKSTYIDALLTLIVPSKKDRFYNQSSGVERKGDRTEETYVLGHFGNIQEEGKISSSTQKLRDTNTYSVLLANFSNTDQKQVTLFQVRWFANNELKRQFGIAHVPLEIDKDFWPFDANGKWKKMLEKKYNSSAIKKRIEFLDGPTAYGERLAGLFGMRSSKALSLFNQVVGVKVLEDLDDFIRTNMLEEQDAESKFIQLKESFLTLMDARTNIEKAKEQIAQLRPIVELSGNLSNLLEELKALERSRELAVFWFQSKTIELGELELENCKKGLQKLEDEIKLLKEKEEYLKDEERRISISIENDKIGSQIKELEREIKFLQKSKDERSRNLDGYSNLAKLLDFNTIPSDKQFDSDKKKASELIIKTMGQIEIESEDLRKFKNGNDEISIKIESLVDTIQALQRNKNNISGREAAIRDEIITYIGADKSEIPFVGELIKVKEVEMSWEASIEKVLHNFALRLIVPKKFYSKVNEYVNGNNLKGRIRFDVFEKEEYLKNMYSREIDKNSLINKIEIKSDTAYYDWIEDYLYRQFNFSCVANLTEFERYSEMAMTQNGLVKFRKGTHEKDDRAHVNNKENYVLGWDNKEKINRLKKELNLLQENQKDIVKSISFKNQEINRLSSLRDKFNEINIKFENYDSIDWQTYAKQIQEKETQIKELENASDKVKKMKEQLEEVRKELKHLTDVEMEHKRKEFYSIETRQKSILTSVEKSRDILDSIVKPESLSEFESKNSNLINLQHDEIESAQKLFQENNSKQIKVLEDKKRGIEDQLKSRLYKFKQPSEDIFNKYKDWRSDVSSLPEPSNLDLVSEYQVMLERLERDNLPKFEKKFNEYLQETITNKIGEFKVFFTDWEDSIRGNIQHLNDSLMGIDFKSKPNTYIQLVASKKTNDEVKEFRNLLDKAVPNVREIDSVVDGRKLHFMNNIVPFIEKLDKEDYRKKVMDVRTWFSYKAEEFWRENKQKFKTYEAMGQLSGGEKAQLTYTILGSAIAYQFGLTKEGLQTNSFRFIAIDEAFKAQDEDKARYLIKLCKQLHLQLLVVTPSDNIHIVEDDISFVHFVERKEERHSWLYDMPIEQFKEEKTNYLIK